MMAQHMPLLILPFLLLFAIFAIVALIPLAIVQRYRVGTSRQRARGWLATINLAGLSLSSIFLVLTAGISSMWVPGTLAYAVMGLAVGSVLGVVGLWLTRWDPTIDALHYTPNRVLVFGLMLIVTGRLLYGVWRGWQSWRAGIHGESWVVASGVAGSIAAGAIVLGYYLVYWIGVRRRLRQHASRRLSRL
jgi:hypothetical protein